MPRFIKFALSQTLSFFGFSRACQTPFFGGAALSLSLLHWYKLSKSHYKSLFLRLLLQVCTSQKLFVISKISTSGCSQKNLAIFQVFIAIDGHRIRVWVV